MAVIFLDLKSYHQHLLLMGDRVRDAAVRGLKSAAMHAVTELVRRTREAPPPNPAGVGSGGAVDLGNFIRRWRWVGTPHGAEVLNDSTYAPVIEKGRRPGAKMPPVAPIMEWARRKLNLGALTSRRVRQLRAANAAHVVAHLRATQSAHVLEHELHTIAWLIARSIKSRGLKARPLMTAPDFEEWMTREANREVAAAIDKVVTGEER